MQITKKVFAFTIGWLLLTTSVGAQKTKTKQTQPGVEEIKKRAVGHWQSLTPEIRPGNSKNPDGTLKPLYLSRDFVFSPGDVFELAVTTYADPYGKISLAKIYIKGHTEWKGEHPITAGAQKVDFTADLEYTVTPQNQGFADVLNKYTKGYNEWKVGETQSILKKAFAPFGLSDGQIFKEYDLVYLAGGLMFWGARNIDGRGFDTEENRPTNLQVPMKKVK